MHKPIPTGTIRTSLVTHAELRCAGLTNSAIGKRVKRGALARRYPGVYSYEPGDLSREAAWLAAVLACGDGAVLNDRSAATLFGVSRWPTTARMSSCRAGTARSRASSSITACGSTLVT